MIYRIAPDPRIPFIQGWYERIRLDGGMWYRNWHGGRLRAVGITVIEKMPVTLSQYMSAQKAAARLKGGPAANPAVPRV